MATGTNTSWESNALTNELVLAPKIDKVSTYSSGVDSHAVILIVYISTGDGDGRAGSNIKTIRVSTKTVSVTILCIDGNSGNCQIGSAVDTHHLDGWVVEVKVLNSWGD